MPFPKVPLLNVELDNCTFSELLNQLKQGGFVVTPNVDHLVKLQHDSEFLHVYQHADYVVCDSQILVWVARLLGTPIKDKISGSDLFPAFYQHYAADPEETIFLLGGNEADVAIAAQDNINAKVYAYLEYQNLSPRDMVIAHYSPPRGFEIDPEEGAKIIQQVNESQATVLAVGVGAPKQEKWIYHHRHLMPGVKTFFAIGATIDFEAGEISRAPTWMSPLGLEWLFRLWADPKRLWRRYLVESLPFAWFILCQRFNRYRHHKPLLLLLQDAGLLSTQQVNQVFREQYRYERQKLDIPTAATLINQYQWLEPETIRFFDGAIAHLLNSSTPPVSILTLLNQAHLLNEVQCNTLKAESVQLNGVPEELALHKGWLGQQTLRFFQQLHTLSQNPRNHRLERLFFISPNPL